MTFGSSAVEMKQIAFIDCAVADIETLRAGLRPDIEAVMLSSLQAAPRQIAIALQGRCDVEAIHIIAHGQPGEVSFGAGALSLETIEEHRSHLAEIGRALAADGEIRLWVCDAARGRRGAAFLDGLRLATGAAVSGATGLVGAAARGARWELDASVDGTAQPPLTGEGIANYAGVMTNVTATTGTDNPTLSSNADTVTVTNTNQVQAADKFSAGNGTDTIQIGTAGAGVDIDLSAAAADGVNGFLSFENVAFTNTSGTSTATFNGAQFGSGKISDSALITGTSATQGVVVNVAAGGTFTAANWSFSGWTSGTDTITIKGTSGTETLTGSSQIDTIVGGTGVDTITGGAGGDTLTGGAGSDIFNFAAGDSVLTFGGSGMSGTVSGYDIITDFTSGTSAAGSEKLGFSGASVAANTAGVNGTNSTLLLNTGNAVSSHAINNGIITFDDASTFAGAVSLTTMGDVAAVAQYLLANDIGSAGTSVAFTATISGVTHTYVYTQGSSNTGTNNELVDLVNVSATSMTAASGQLSIIDNTAPTAPSITSITESGGGGINAGEASDGTPVVVSLAGTGATSGDTLTVNWGGQTVTYTLLGTDIVAGSVTVPVPAADDRGAGQRHVQCYREAD